VSSTLVQQVIDRYLTLARSLPIDGLFVQDGPPTVEVRAVPRVLVLAGRWDTGADGRGAARSTQVPAGGNASRSEAITVTGSAFAQSGDTDMADRRTEVFEVLAVLEQAVVDDRTLGGLVMGDARLASVDDYRPVQNERGSAAVVDFTLSATALLWDG
jgi:hypothetical protein